MNNSHYISPTNDIVKELSQNFIDYATAVNEDRSLPDTRSGLKPVARRILYGAYVNGRTSNKPCVKNARIVGDVMGQLHPHGDSSIYGALVRLSQDWVMRYPLIDFHGNQGNIAGDGPAAMRYTEGRLAKLSEDGMLANIKKDNVPFMPNYDDTMEEPATLPAIFPNLLCNPNTGIGVAMACNWASHNLGEVAQAIYDYIAGKEPMLLGPDFPTGGEIINKDDIPAIMRTGRGSVKIRGRYKVEDNKIIFYEIPYGTITETILQEIAKLCELKEINGIEEIQDQSNKKGLRIVIECEKGASILTVVNKLFEKTSLQTSFSYNQVGLVDKVPTELNLKDCCKIYVDHNIECLKRETTWDLNKATERNHIIEGLLVALEDIDNVIVLIKSSDSSEDARIKLIKKYNLSEVQAKAILAMRLSSLAHLEKIELENEHKELMDKIKYWKELFSSVELQRQVIQKRLAELVDKYGDARRTVLTQINPPSKEEKEIINVEPEKCVVIMTESGLIKRVPSSSFRVQKRNGAGVKTQDGITSAIIRTNTIDSLMVFTDKGRMYRILVDNIPSGTNASKGVPIKSLIEMESFENPTLIYSIYYDTDAKYIMFVTKNGTVKKTALEEYTKTKKKSGVAAINLREGDEIASVSLIKDEQVILLTEKGMGIKFKTSEVSPSGRATMGVKGIALGEGDKVVTALPIRSNEDQLAIFSENGLGKRIKIDEFVTQSRGGKGIICYKPTSSTGNVVAGTLVADSDNLLVSGSTKSICIGANDISTVGRASIGVQIIKEGHITSVSKI